MLIMFPQQSARISMADRRIPVTLIVMVAVILIEVSNFVKNNMRIKKLFNLLIPISILSVFIHGWLLNSLRVVTVFAYLERKEASD